MDVDLVEQSGEHVERVAVDHREHGVQVHLGAGLAEMDHDDPGDSAGREQPPGEDLDGGRGGALTEADHDGVFVENEHVPTLDRRRVVVALTRTEPHRDVREQGVVPVDGLHVEGLAGPGRSGQHVDRDPVVDPRCVVPHEEEVGQRADPVVESVGDQLGEQVVHPEALEFRLEQAADEDVDEVAHRDRGERSGELLGDTGPALGRSEHPLQEPEPDILRLQCLGEQPFEVEDLDAPILHHLNEAVVFLTGAIQPQQIVEEKGVLVVGGDAGDLDPGSMHEHRSEPPDLGGDAERHRVASAAVSRKRATASASPSTVSVETGPRPQPKRSRSAAAPETVVCR